MTTEIIWTPEGENETDLIPAHVTRVMKVARELRIFFSGGATQRMPLPQCCSQPQR